MVNSWKAAVSERRRVLQNPYAFHDELAEFESLSAARKLGEDPYAYAEELDQFSALPASQQVGSPDQSRVSTQKHRRYSDTEIARLVKSIHTNIWKERHAIFMNADSMDPIDMLDPVVTLRMMGYGVEFVDSLSSTHENGAPINVAGLIDKRDRRVMLSSAFPKAVQKYTAAHELGHASMHTFAGMHRDNPLSGPLATRDVVEREADRFAALFLMPERLVRAEFERRFGQIPFSLNEETEFALAGTIGNSKKGLPKTPRELSRILSNTSNFNGSNFTPLSLRFNVSLEAMSIRLEQLNAIRWARY